MSVVDIDRAASGPRLKDRMRPEDLSTEGVTNLVSALLRAASEELAEAVAYVYKNPSEDNLYHLRIARRFFRTEWFTVLSLGMVDGETVIRRIVAQALRRRVPRGEALQ